MTVPNCPDHEDVVLDLARGLLDDREALRAENVRKGCVHCKAWWSETFGDGVLTVVDGAVAQAFAGFRAPARRRRRMWLAAAAAVVLAVALGSTSIFWRNVGAERAGPTQVVSDPAVISTVDFEDGIVATQTISAADSPTPEAQPGSESVLFTSDLESGDFHGWSSHS